MAPPLSHYKYKLVAQLLEAGVSKQSIADEVGVVKSTVIYVARNEYKKGIKTGKVWHCPNCGGNVYTTFCRLCHVRERIAEGKVLSLQGTFSGDLDLVLDDECQVRYDRLVSCRNRNLRRGIVVGAT